MSATASTILSIVRFRPLRFLRAIVTLAAGLALSIAFAACSSSSASPETSPPVRIASQVVATVETDPVPHRGDAADDPAIWVNPTDPAKSTIIGTDKKGGLAVYNLAGKQIQYLADGPMNNVDLRRGFPLAGGKAAVVTALNRATDTVAVYRVDPQTRGLVDVAARRIELGISSYGSCMYRSPRSGKFYLFANSEKGEVEQWELFDDGRGKVDARTVRSFDVGTQTEGCVADDGLASLFIAEERRGIWVYDAEPGGGTSRTKVDSTDGLGHLRADVEGLTIAYGPNGTGYLFASSQGDSTYAVYRRGGAHEYLGSFQIVDGGEIDGTQHTDGIDVTSAGLGPAFPRGVLVLHDGRNEGGNQNFKLVPLESILRS